MTSLYPVFSFNTGETFNFMLHKVLGRGEKNKLSQFCDKVLKTLLLKMINSLSRSLQLWVIHSTVFWKGIFQKLQRSPRKRNTAVLSLLIVVAYFAVYRSNNWYIIYRFLPEERGFLPKLRQETLPCQDLIKTARLILDGQPIPLPYNNMKTLWKFKQRAPKKFIKENLIFGENLNENKAEILKRREFYNVTSHEIKADTMLITFGHNCCAYSKQRALKKAKTVGGFDYVRSFNLDAMTLKFRETHKDLLKARRGAGYWLWKPYIMLKTLIENMNTSDIVMYQDAGAYIIRSTGPLLKLCEQSKEGIIVFSLGKIEHEYTKQDAFILMNMSFPEATDTFQRLASFVVLRKSCTSIQFAMEWLAYVSDKRIVSDEPNALGVPNPDSFRDNRHDQTVLSLLSKKWGLSAYRDPSQYGESVPGNSYYSSGPYKQIFMHDRFKH
jgi:hypothetical protein